MSPDETRTLIAEVLGIDPARVRDPLAFGDLPEWDSLNHVNLMLALEERLDVEIDAERMVQLATVALIKQFASEHDVQAPLPDELRLTQR